jgi:hypothetical protein
MDIVLGPCPRVLSICVCKRIPRKRATQKRVSRERRRKAHQRRQGSEYRDLT